MKSLLAALALGFTLSGAATAATVTNGSFEGPGTFSGDFQTIFTPSTALTGWKVSAGSVDLINRYWQNDHGYYSLDMSGNNAGAISQMIGGLIAGRSYVLSFAMAGNPDRAYEKTLTASVGSTSKDFVFDSTGKTRAAMGWTTMTMVFEAEESSQLLSFASKTRGAWGAALDDVELTIVPVPLPAAGSMLLAGLGGLLLLRRRRRA